jgi:hypothetical protein
MADADTCRSDALAALLVLARRALNARAEAHEDGAARWRRQCRIGRGLPVAVRGSTCSQCCVRPISPRSRSGASSRNARRGTAGDGCGVMGDQAVIRFVAHYERITR